MTAIFAEAPALPLHTAGKYVAAAYIVFVLVLIVYVAIMAARLTRSNRELLELRARIDAPERGEARERTATHGPGAPAESTPAPSLLNRDENENQTHSHMGVGTTVAGTSGRSLHE